MKKDQSILSVCIVLAVFNPNTEFLRKQIQSIRNQSNKNWICYISDDASTTQWLPEVKDLLDKRFVVSKSLNNVGPYRNFEKLLRNVKNEEIVFFCDQDDIWATEKISKILSEFKNKVTLVYSDAKIINNLDEVTIPSLHEYEKTETRFNSSLGLILKNSITGCTAAVRREVLESALPFPELGGVQHDLWIGVVAARQGEIVYLPEKLISYRRHTSNVIGATAPKFFREFINFRVAAISFLIKNQILKTYWNKFESRRLPTLGSILFSSNLSRRQKLYGINFYLGRAVVYVHDFPVRIRISLHRFWYGISARLLRVQKKLVIALISKNRIFRSLRFTLRLVASKQIRQESIKSLKTVESKDFQTSDLKVMTMGRRVPEIKTLRTVMSRKKSNSIVFFIPSLDASVIFGGIATAIRIACALAEKISVRICVTDQEESPIPEELILQLVETLDLNDQSLRSILKKVEFGKVSFSKSDIFFTTAWWTTEMASQAAKTLEGSKIPIFYLVQDFEPLFYPASNQYAEALNTYKIADYLVVNSRSLADYVSDTIKVPIRSKLVFEPQFLRMDLPIRQLEKNRIGPIKIVVYGRPNTPRNLFQLLVNSLEFALPLSSELSFEIVSVGEKHDDVLLGSGHVIRSLGKLSVGDYLDLISAADIGVSLMLSPHPSYPPLEMASAGMQVVTNDYFGYKEDLGNVYSNLHVVEASVKDIGAKIVQLISSIPKNQKSRNPSKDLGYSIDIVVSEILKIVRKLNEKSIT